MTWRHFSRSEFDCNCCGGNEIEYSFVDRLDELREILGFPLKITSGYRCPVHNERVSTTGQNGPHTTGRAADITIARLDAYKLMQEAVGLGFTGVGFKQKGSHRFIHLDDLQDTISHPRPTIWTY